MDEPARRVVIPYQPRPLQQRFHEAFAERRPRAAVLVVHRRFGKSVMAVNELIRQAVQCEHEQPRYAYIAPLYKQAKDIAWDYVKKYAGPIPGVAFNEQELRCDLPNGARLKLLGAEHADSLRGIYLDGVVLDEYAYMAPDAWPSVIRPTLVDRQGFALFLGTPLGRNHFHALYERAQAQGYLTALWRASETHVIPEAELALARAEMTPEWYAQEFECSFEAAIKGAYYARELEQARAAGRIREFALEPALPVETVWDLGWDDSTAILFVQRLGREVRIVDTLEARGQNLAWYAAALQARGYVYSRHVLPHDVEVHELGSGKSRLELLAGLGVRPITVLGANEPADGIQQARLLFPRVWFRESACRGLLDALGGYRAAWDARAMKFKDQPLHDWTSHYADAFRYLAVSLHDLRGEPKRSAARSLGPADFSPFRLHEARGMRG